MRTINGYLAQLSHVTIKKLKDAIFALIILDIINYFNLNSFISISFIKFKSDVNGP